MRLMWMMVLCGTVMGDWNIKPAMGMPEKTEHTRTSSLKRTISFIKRDSAPAHQAEAPIDQKTLIRAYHNAFSNHAAYAKLYNTLAARASSSSDTKGHFLFSKTPPPVEEFQKIVKGQEEPLKLFILLNRLEKTVQALKKKVQDPNLQAFYETLRSYVFQKYGPQYASYTVLHQTGIEEIFKQFNACITRTNTFQAFHSNLIAINKCHTVSSSEKETLNTLETLPLVFPSKPPINQDQAYQKEKQAFSSMLTDAFLGKRDSLFRILFSGENFLNFLPATAPISQEEIYTCLLTFIEHTPCDTSRKGTLLARLRDALQEAKNIKHICKEHLQTVLKKLLASETLTTDQTNAIQQHLDCVNDDKAFNTVNALKWQRIP